MQGMNISIPDPLKEFVDQQIASGRYGSVSEYVRELIRADQKRKAEERIDALLLDGLDSGGSVAVGDEYWEAKKQKLAARLGKTIGRQ